MKLVQCVPNFSEGRREDVIDEIVAELDDYEVTVLDVSPDADHNRTDVTFIAKPEIAKNAAMDLALTAVELIDMREQEGEHPRMGAIDVVPFIPLMDTEMEDCVELAEDFAEEFAERADVPTYLYEDAARKPRRENLADVREGEYEGLRDEIGSNPKKQPDFGPNHINETAGATAVGARFFLVAFNVNLDTDDLEIAQEIGRNVRHSSGGYRHVKAMGFEIEERGIVQVSMNMTDFRGTPLFRVFETIKDEANRHGVTVVGSELVGQVPMEALIDVADHYLRLEDFETEQVLEQRLLEEGR
ncbi:MAG: glutamate formiminotransferase [Halobacteriales archaeon]|jgi:glutamate formiminotransferase